MAANSASPRPFWSGIIAFGLVSIPVSLFPANGGSGLSLRMVDQNGTFLRRQYFCEREKIALEPDEIVRGYEVDTDQYVVVEDDELEALAPKKSQEIDLSRFVALDEINPVHFDRAYFLVPDKGATKAYRLLARSMEEEQRAGIATFVMRGKEYLVSIVAQQGILRAETMRFHDEIRSPQDIGLPEPAEADSKLVEEFRKAMQGHARKALDRDYLTDVQSQKLRDYAEAKYDSGRDVITPASKDAVEDGGPSNVIDLMSVLEQRLQGREQESDESDSSELESAKPTQKKKTAKRKKAAGKVARGKKAASAGKKKKAKTG
jgi:DNA end-binding protein Ku